MAISYTAVHTLLDNTLQAIEGMPTVNRESTLLTMTSSGTYVRVTNIPAKQVTTTIGQQPIKKLMGKYQIDIFTPMNHGTAASDLIVDSICNAMNVGTVLVDENGNQVYIDNTYPLGAWIYDKFRNSPVVISWFSYQV